MKDFRLAAVSLAPRYGIITENATAIRRWMKEAAAADADLVVFPEGLLSGYDLDQLEGSALAFTDGRIEELARQAEELDVIVSVGFLEREGTDFYVAQAYLGRGLRLVYRKCHRTAWEKQHCRPGQGLPVHDLGFVRAGTLICYDSAFPRACETLALNGAELIVSPTCHPLGREVEEAGIEEACRRRRAHVRKYWGARAYDYTMFTCYVDHAGRSSKGEQFSGHIVIFGPDGEPVAEKTTASEGMLVADLSAAQLEECRRQEVGHFHVLKDSRPELYEGTNLGVPSSASGGTGPMESRIRYWPGTS